MKSTLKYFRCVSVILHPMLISAIAFIILIATDATITYREKSAYLLISILFSTAIPVLYVSFQYKKKTISSLDIDVREQRSHPLLVGIAGYLIGYLILEILRAPALIRGLMFCYATNTFIVFAVTRYWKVSIHVTGIAGPLAALTFRFGMTVLPFYTLIVLMAVSRVVLGKHTPLQVCAGAFIGLACTALQLDILFI